MTTTSVFQGIQEGSKLSSRVLRPPGGGSSISFMDDNFSSKSSSESSLQHSPPQSPGKISETTSPLPPNKNESTVSTPAAKMENGTHHTEELQSANKNSTLKENIPPPILSEKEFESKLNVSLNGNLNKEIVSNSEPQPSVLNNDSKTDTKQKPMLNESPECKPANGVNDAKGKGTFDKESNMLNGNSVFEKINSPNYTPSKIYSIVQDGSSFIASPSMKPNQDTRERVIGHAVETVTPPQSSQQPRKIKDHMRSNILMSDEDYTPTRSHRFNATINDTPPENLPSAGQRQRVPPGGFSSKLW